MSLFETNATILGNSSLKEYVLSNGTKIISDTPVNFYTDAEILKIEVAGGVMVLAILVITYALYKWYMMRYYRWQRNEKIREKMEAGTVTDEDLAELEMPLPGINKGLMAAAGILVIIAGVAMYLMP